MEKNKKFDKRLFVQKLETPLLNSYDVNYEMGKGTFSKVYEVKHKKTGEIRACKYISKTNFKEDDLKRFKDEIKILQESDHPNIVKLYEVFETPKSFYLIMEKCNGGNLYFKCEQRMVTKIPYEERILSEIIRQIASAIKYCHDKDICHRDLKPENICFLNLGNMDNNFIKVIDFGYGKIMDAISKIHTQVGSMLYIAPEVLNRKYNKKCDIWSLGVILFFLISGKPPFLGQNDTETKKKIILMKYEFDKEWDSVSKEAKDLIKHMLCKEEERYSAQEVLEHPWIKKEKTFPNNLEVNQNQFRSYQKMNNFEKKIITFIASRLNDNTINNLKYFFIAFDKNNDGKIDFNEFYNGIKNMPSFNMKKEEIKQIFKHIDTNQDGKIEYTEFIASCLNENLYLNKDKLEEIFEAFDKKGNGKISKEDIISVLELNEFCAKKLENIFNKIDKDNEGKINSEQFNEMITHVIKETLNKKVKVK